MNPALAKNNKLNNTGKSGVNRLPAWFRQEIPDENTFSQLQLLSQFKVHTVCREAKCPNLSDCFKRQRLTFMLLGDTCSRNCCFCAVKKSVASPLNIDEDEPYRISQVIRLLALNYVVLTSVTRDDLADGGAGIFAQTIELIHAINRKIKVEVLIPDFSGKLSSLKTVVDAEPSVVAHNLETVKRLYPEVRPKANYLLSLDILRKIKECKPSLVTKSSLILGLGEKEEEVIDMLKDLKDAGCDILTLGQYLAPSVHHYPVQEFISPEQFMKYRKLALSLGFKAVFSGPLVRSSYCAEEVYGELIAV